MIHTHRPASRMVATISAAHWPGSKPTSLADQSKIITMPTASTAQAAIATLQSSDTPPDVVVVLTTAGPKR